MAFQTRQTRHWAECVLVVAFMLAEPAISKTPDPLALQTQLEQMQKLQQATADELKTQNKELQERLKAQETALLETQRKSIDWWFSLLGALVGALAVIFGALPLLLTRQQKAEIDKELTLAKELVASIRGHEQQARDTTEKLINSYASGQPQSAAQQVEIKREIESIERSPTATDADKLRARAIQASEVNNPTTAQALAAFDLWKALTVLVPKDASPQFNAGYWAQELYKQSAKPGKTHWFEELVSFYGQALQIKPDKHEAAQNWGSALLYEAHALRAVGMHDEAASVMGRAATLLEQHLTVWPDARGQLAYNLACVYSLQGRAAEAVAQLETARAAGKLTTHWQTDPDLNPIRTSAEYLAWVAQHCPDANSSTA